MNIKAFNDKRDRLNKLMGKRDEFFSIFGKLDDEVYSDSVIPKKYKELIGLSISIVNKCEECIIYHIQNCITEGASEKEIIETIKIAIIGAGSVSIPYARLTFEAMEELL